MADRRTQGNSDYYSRERKNQNKVKRFHFHPLEGATKGVDTGKRSTTSSNHDISKTKRAKRRGGISMKFS